MQPNRENFEKLFSSLDFNGIRGEDIFKILKESRVHDNCTHHEETLYDHLFLTAEATHLYAKDNGWCSLINGHISPKCCLDSPWVFYLCGFFHDIGKPGAYRPAYVSIGKKQRLVTKGHGPIGAAILDSWLLNSPEMLRTFSLTERDAVAITMSTNYHMCRSPEENEIDDYRLEFLANCISIGAAYLLVALRYGDFMGKLPKRDFIYHIQKQYERRLLFYTIYLPNIVLKRNNGLLINVTGCRGAGKTTLSEKLIQFIKENFKLEINEDVFYLNRHAVIREIVTKSSLYNKEAGCDVYQVYEDNKHTFTELVNRELQNRVTNILSAQRICILDTTAMMDYRARKNILANVHPDTLRVDLWATRFPDTSIERGTRKKMKMIVEQERNVNGKSEMTPMDPIGFNIYWTQVESLLEDNEIICLDKCTNNKFKSHFTIPVGHECRFTMPAVKILLNNILTSRQTKSERYKPPPLLEESIEMSLHQLVERLANQNSLEHMKIFFEAHSYAYTCQEVLAPGKAYTVCVKYIDRKNRLWKPEWAREARGRGFLLWKEEGEELFKVYDFKISLPRCVELLTKVHSSQGFTASQDMENDLDVSFLDVAQQEMVRKFNLRPEEEFDDGEEWYLTEKVDGCLLVVSIIPSTNPIYKLLQIILKEGNLNIWHIFTEKYLIIPATSGSIQVGEKMKATFITAFYSILTGEKNNPPADKNPDEIWEECIKKPFGEAMVYLAGDNTKKTTAIMEMVCENRRCYDGYIHHELAVAYNQSNVFLLGLFSGIEYVPSYKLDEKKILAFTIPRTKQIKTPQEALDNLKNVSEFLLLSNDNDEQIHPEGFIVTCHRAKDGQMLASCKLKTSIFYKAHALGKKYLELFNDDKNKTMKKNFDDDDIIIYTNYSLVNKIFPEVKRIQFIYQILPELIKKFCKHMYNNVLSKYEKEDNLPFNSEKNKTTTTKIMDPINVAKYFLAIHSEKLGLLKEFIEFFQNEWDYLYTEEKAVTKATQIILILNEGFIRNHTKDVKIIKIFADLFQ